MVAVYNGDPTIRANKYHGVNFSLNGPLFAIGEVGYQFNGLPGDTQRLGNYKLGAWFDDSEVTNFESGAATRGSWGFYGLFAFFIQPDFQYIIQTGGTSRLNNAPLFASQFGINF